MSLVSVQDRKGNNPGDIQKESGVRVLRYGHSPLKSTIVQGNEVENEVDIMKEGKYKQQMGRTGRKSLYKVAKELGVPLIGSSQIDDEMDTNTFSHLAGLREGKDRNGTKQN